MAEKKMIQVRDVSMVFNLSREKIESLKEYFVKLMKRQLLYEEFTALSNVSFDVCSGEILGVVGLNGSGKSTLLKIVAGIIKPTSGKAEVYGKIAPLIELGAGFIPDLTGRENIFLNGYILGYSKQFMESNIGAIVEFSELGAFIDIPIKNYSSGMRARLGFSIATTVKPDVLIVDEVLSVGDFKFQKKCLARIKELMSGKTAVLFVSHSIAQVRELCTRCVLLENGKLVMDGSTDEVCGVFERK